MSVCDPEGGMHRLWRGVLPEQVFVPEPPAAFDPAYVAVVTEAVERRRDELAAVIVEPVVQGAGGMRFHDPAYLRVLRELCDRYQILLIFDEIATGFGRTGAFFAAEHAGVRPDVMCVGKALTGGYLSMAAALCTLVNDHLDLFFNASVDAAIVLATFLRAVEAVGLGCCPISAIRDHASFVSTLLELPERVIPIAGVCVGWPAESGGITSRLGLDATIHHDRYGSGNLAAQIDAYDRRREARRPYRSQRNPERWGMAAAYGWSEDKARQYAEPLRADFGAFVRAKGFCLD